jgi:glycosyltransferase involved in cell wall biosynthesis
MSQMLRLTAVVCTRNRASWAAQAVRSLLAQDIASERMEIVVVDNASTDETAAVFDELFAEQPNAHYVFEPQPGLSRARNRGIAESSGDVIAFLDDDAEAVPGWASAHLRTFEADPSVAGTGGPIRLGWPDRRPAWLPPSWDGMYSGLDRGPDLHVMSHPRIPYGANMAVRLRSLAGGPGFHVALGRQGEDLTSGEERELFERLRAGGGDLVYVPDAVVTHHVLPDRIGKRWFLRRAYAQGRSHVLIDDYMRRRGGALYWLGRCGYQGGRAGVHLARWLLQTATHRPPDAVTDTLATAVKASGASRESARAFARSLRRSHGTPRDPEPGRHSSNE